MPNKAFLFILLALTALALPQAYAGEAEPTADDVVLEKRVNAVSEELRCLVCQNQTIADSHAELAIDLKNQVREKLKQGMSEREIVDYMVERYGDFVLYRPQVKSSTLLLWFGPFALLLLAFGVLVAKLRQRRKAMREVPKLSADDHARAESLLSGKDKGAQS
ncbi:MAG: cytochrome c-type biogenesis protein CcmH [Nitrosomonadales bacterium]|nr:cytochrome c-type biogenesis protein CcmH [Nitrosomonadales bacterium]